MQKQSLKRSSLKTFAFFTYIFQNINQSPRQIVSAIFANTAQIILAVSMLTKDSATKKMCLEISLEIHFQWQVFLEAYSNFNHKLGF